MSYFFTSKRRAVLTAAEGMNPDVEAMLRFAWQINSSRSVFDELVEYILRVYEDKVPDISYALASYIVSYSLRMQQEIIDLFIGKGEASALVLAKRKLNTSLEEREISALLISMIYLKKTNEKDAGEILNLFHLRSSQYQEYEMVEKHEMVFNETLGKELDIPVLEDEVRTLENTKPSLEE